MASMCEDLERKLHHRQPRPRPFTRWPVAVIIARNRAANTGVRQRVRKVGDGWAISAVDHA